MNQKKYIHLENVHNLKSASIIVPEILKILSIQSVLDVGCGIGTWLHVFKKNGINDIKGIDGHYVDKKLLYKYLSPENFEAINLEKPFNLKKKYDLVISLEVAEHLEEFSADSFVESICLHSDTIIFSAAIPGQGGQNHLNEQWPNYWAKKFSKHSYVFLDLIRPLIWDNPWVDYWYKQNIFLVVKTDNELAKNYLSSSLGLVHPELLKQKEETYQKRISNLERSLAVHPLKRWVKSIFKV